MGGLNFGQGEFSDRLAFAEIGKGTAFWGQLGKTFAHFDGSPFDGACNHHPVELQILVCDWGGGRWWWGRRWWWYPVWPDLALGIKGVVDLQ